MDITQIRMFKSGCFYFVFMPVLALFLQELLEPQLLQLELLVQEP